MLISSRSFSKSNLSFWHPLFVILIFHIWIFSNRLAKWSYYKDCSFGPNPLTNMAAIVIPDWSISKMFSLKPLDQVNRILVESIHKRSSIRFPPFIPIGQFLFLIGWNKKKSSPLKLGGTMNCYFVGMLYGRSCIKLPHFVPIIVLIWPP